MRALRVLVLSAALAALAVGTPAPNAHAEVERTQAFHDDVDQAIRRGAAWLLSQQAPDGSWPSDYEHAYPLAMTALCYHTLAVCGVPCNDPQMEKAYFRLREEYATRRRLSRLRVYTAAVLMMAVADHARGDAVGSRAVGVGDGGDGPRGDSDEAWMRELVRYMVAAQNDRGAWHYGNVAGRYGDRGRGSSWDHSNTQYALLGLKAARRMGVEVHPLVFRRALEHLIGTQEDSGRKVLRNPGKRAGRTRERAYDRARGWSYQLAAGANAYGSMTAGSLGALVICRSELIDTAGYPATLDARAEQSIWDGIAWLGREFEVRENPGGYAWHYYYLYGVERAGVLAGVDYVGEHDWYGLGTEYLLSAQADDGGWSDAGGRGLATCFALLFLRRGTLPVPKGAVTPSIEEDPDLFDGAELLTGKDFEDFVDLIVSRYARTASASTQESFARGMVDMGQRIVPALLKRMGAGRPPNRRAAHALLVATTGLALPFDPDAEPGKRGEDLLAFEVWYMENKLRLRKDRKTGLLAPQPE